MTQVPANQTLADQLAKIEQMVGKPRVLSSESEDGYRAVLTGVVESLKPRSAIALLQAKNLADEIWEAERYKRHQIMAIERQERTNRRLDAERARIAADRKARKEEHGEFVEIIKEGSAYSKAIVNSVIEDVVAEVDGILTQVPDELAYARAMEDTIDYVHKLDELKDASTRRKNDILNSYRDFEPTRQDVVDGEFNEIGSAETIVIAGVPWQPPAK